MQALLERFSVAAKLGILTTLALLCSLTLVTLNLAESRNAMLADRQASVGHVVDSAYSLVEHFGNEASAGRIPVAQAQELAKNALASIRYNKGDYFSLYDTQYNMVKHPIKPEMDGKNFASLADKDGVLIVKDIVDHAQRGDGAYTEYLWPRAGQEGTFRKIARGRLYQPWGWVLATGIYVDDINALFWQRMWLTLGASAAVVVVLLLTAALIGRSISRPLAQLRQVIQAIDTQDDLTQRIPVYNPRTELGGIGEAYNHMADKLQRTLRTFGVSVRELRDASGKLVDQASAIERQSNAQSGAASSTAEAVETVSHAITQAAEGAGSAFDLSVQSRSLAGEGRDVVLRAVSEMNEIEVSVDASAKRIALLEEQSGKINEIVGVIKGIAEQTNLLALNAAIEAARAGESGRGFAVVADEVRKLAERTASSTQEISGMVGNIQLQVREAVSDIQRSCSLVQNGVQLASQAGNSMQQIGQQIQATSTMIQEISEATQTQSCQVNNIAGNVSQIAEKARDNASSVSAVTGEAKRLSELAQELDTTTSRFKV